MSLRSRLARLGSAGGHADKASAPADPPFISFAPSLSAVRPALVAASSPSSDPVVSGPLLEDLRKRMDAILTRTRNEPKRELPAVDCPELPFCVERTELGPLHVRTLRLSGAHRVGRIPITGARTASSELLALLALDPRLARCDLGGALYLDTETTGLGPGAGTVAFLIGLAFWDADIGLVCEQLLVRQLGEEAPVLARVAERIKQASMLVTFNGKSFDLPVLRTRFVMGRAVFPDEPPHLDLVHVARRLHQGRGFGARLGAVEREVLGFVRENDVPSGEVCACYLHFLRTGDTRALLGVVDHNLWDVISMAAIVGLYGEPLEGSQLHADDLVGVARTLKRAGDNDQAQLVVETALARGAGDAALRVRADLSKARGDKARALADFEALAASVDDPSIRLELAKLYEHHAKDAARALALVEAGTGEKEDRRAHRAARLARKAAATGKLWHKSGAMSEQDAHAPHPYDPAVIEPKWQHVWEEQKTFRAVRHPGRAKMYVLDMFPYPSGDGLHVGHPEGYTATDIICRYKRMNGFDVLHPMGWDAFGLPAEQFAIAKNKHPGGFTQTNIDKFRGQLKRLGFSFDWDREVDTTHPGYVKWTQWIFLQLFHKGLAFQQDNMAVNWCANLGTVLANDEVGPDGRSVLGGHPIEKLKIRQWSLRITQYADRLLAGLEGLDWPETKVKQTNWIGRSEGANVEFAVEGHDAKITVFTTRVDTLPGATYVVLAPEHALAVQISLPDHRVAVKAYADIANAKSDIVRGDATREKTGVPTGAFAINPINGERVPVYVADYVIGGYGSGAVMAVPAHDERDHAFALKYGLPIIEVVHPTQSVTPLVDVQKEAFTDDGVATDNAVARSNAPIEKGMPSERVRRVVTDWLAAQGKGSSKITYKLRDWVFSRQRYWGEPIPIYFPVDCDGDPRAPGAKFTIHYEQPIPVDATELPVMLPDLEDFKPGTDPAGPLARAADWRFFERDGKWYARETNTMPQWAGSCWYYLRFLDPKNSATGWTSEAYDAWMPVDLYVGGSEHAVLHLLYARFWHKVLFDLGLVKGDEPFTKLVHQGMILGTSYRYFQALEGDKRLVPGTAKVLRPTDPPEIRLAETNELLEEKWAQDAEIVLREGKTFHAALGVEVVMVAEKMSKSRGNVVNPDHIVKSHGADSLRLYEMFMGPLEAVKPWQTAAIEGVRRFLDRTWNVCTNVGDDTPTDETRRIVHKTIKKVGEDIEHLRFNTAISAMMILVKHLGALPHTPRECAKAMTLLVSPFAPHIGEELWQRLGATTTLAYEPWPTFDPALVKDDVIEIGVQVNGKARASIQVAVDADEATAKAIALADPKVQQWTNDKTIKKLIYVKGRILNLIVG